MRSISNNLNRILIASGENGGYRENKNKIN